MIILCLDVDPDRVLDVNRVLVDLTAGFSATVTSEDSYAVERERSRRKMRELSERAEELLGEKPGEDLVLKNSQARELKYGKSKSVEIPLGDDGAMAGEVSERLVNLVAHVPPEHPTVQKVLAYFEELKFGPVNLIVTPA